MGYEKIKRPLLAPGVAVVNAEAAPSANSAVGDVLTPSGGIIHDIETVTSTATTLLGKGISVLAPSTLGPITAFKLASPSEAGIHKLISVNMPASSTGTLAVVLATTALTFHGTTMNMFVTSTAADGANVTMGLGFVSVSTSAWAVVSRSTGWTLSGSTLP